ncbi:MAG TPA: hypothetical protein VFG09_04370 [Thermodesulfovibrionales bacterium]|jgi:hypothetical protein|nr:hypothetical protein [Thermodesulfovibrionales bacterium]
MKAAAKTGKTKRGRRVIKVFWKSSDENGRSKRQGREGGEERS